MKELIPLLRSLRAGCAVEILTIAKLLEHFDTDIYHLLGFSSGHTLKHLVAAFAVYLLIRTFEKRAKQ